MPKSRKLKEVTTRPGNKKKKLKKSATIVVDKKNETKALSSKVDIPEKSGFSFEEEAARFARRYGYKQASDTTDDITPPVDPDADTDSPVHRTEHEMIGAEKDDWFEKFKKNIKSSDEEGWEAFYN